MSNDAIIPYIRGIHNGNSIQPSDRIHAMPEVNDDNVNFITEELQEEAVVSNKFLSIVFNWTIKSGRNILVLTAAIVITIFFIRIKIDHDISKSMEIISEQEAKILSMTQIEKEHVKFQKKLEIIKLANENKIDWTQRFNKFSNSLPQDIRIEEIIYTKNDVKFSAIASSSDSFSIFLAGLISDKQVSEILLTGSKYIPQDKSYLFSMEVVLYE